MILSEKIIIIWYIQKFSFRILTLFFKYNSKNCIKKNELIIIGNFTKLFEFIKNIELGILQLLLFS